MPLLPSGTSRSVHPHHQHFSRPFRSDVFFADDFSRSGNAGHSAKLHFHSLGREIRTKYQSIAFELARLHYATREIVAEHVRLVGLLLGIPRDDKQPFKITHCAVRMGPVHNRISARPRFAGVTAGVASALRIERRCCVCLCKVPPAEVQFPQAVHLRRSLLPHVLLRRSANIGRRRSSKGKETKQCCETVPPENDTAHVSLLCSSVFPDEQLPEVRD